MIYVAMLFAAYFFKLALRLNWITAGLAFAFLLGMHWKHRRLYAKQKACLVHFRETCTYLETMLYAFLREGKIDGALRDTGDSLPDGHLRLLVEDASAHIEMSMEESETTANALGLIEGFYPCRRVANLHRFLMHVEFYGGDSKKALLLMAEDKKRWQQRIEAVILERRKALTEVILSVLASIGICACVLWLPVMDADISKNWITQILGLLLLVVDDLLILKAQKYLVTDWTRMDEFKEDGKSKRRLREYRAYDGEWEIRLSILLGLAAGGLSLVLLLTGHSWPALLAMCLTLILANQHRIGLWLKERAICKELRSAFPSWLVDLTLILQSENVQVAIRKSNLKAPGILNDDIERLADELEVDPESSVPYHHFLEEFDLPQVSSAMGMLYSLSMGNTADGRGQLIELVRTNYEELDEAEKIRLKDKTSGMYLLFLAPVLTASFKLMVDMAVFMFSFVGRSFMG